MEEPGSPGLRSSRENRSMPSVPSNEELPRDPGQFSEPEEQKQKPEIDDPILDFQLDEGEQKEKPMFEDDRLNLTDVTRNAHLHART